MKEYEIYGSCRWYEKEGKYIQNFGKETLGKETNMKTQVSMRR
jgi:uncharacterized protein YodC (DUF2158 family)